MKIRSIKPVIYFITMKSVKSHLFICALAAIIFLAVPVHSQKHAELEAKADLVSSYIWRGTYNAGASIQPSLRASIAGFSLGAWGSTDFGGNGKKEVDMSVAYSYKNFSAGITDYWWEGEGAYKYFQYRNFNTAHRFEGNLSYQLPFRKFNFKFSWNTMFAGADYDAEGKRCYSTYIEIAYPFAIGSIDMNAAIGAAPWYSPSFLPTSYRGFSVCNISIGAQRAIKVSDHFSIPLFTQLIFNPATEDIHFVFGLSLSLNN